MIKKTIHFTLFIIASLSFIATFGAVASEKPNHVILTGYTYSCTGRIIGQLVIPGIGNESVHFKLKGKSAKKFVLDKNNRLSIKDGYCNKTDPWYDLIIHANTKKGTIKDTIRVVKDKFIRNKVVAHRGVWKHTGATENSMGSLRKAIEMGCEMSELDVNLSADGVLYVNHDAVIQGVKIDTASSELLSKVKLPNGEYLPTLRSYIDETMKQSATRLLIEVKPFGVSKGRGLEAAEATVEMVRQMRAQAWVVYISFSYDILKKIKELDPYAKVAYLNGDKTPKEIKDSGFWGMDYYNEVYQKNSEWIKQAQDLGLTVNSWVVDKKSDMLSLIDADVEFITTDEPELLFQTIKEYKQRKIQ